MGNRVSDTGKKQSVAQELIGTVIFLREVLRLIRKILCL